MKDISVLRDKKTIETVLRRDPLRHLLALGDLDDPYWASTTWFYGFGELILLYSALSTPVVLAHADGSGREMADLLSACTPKLPKRFYCQVSRQAVAGLEDEYELLGHGSFFQMALQEPQLAPPSQAQVLVDSDVGHLLEFYRDISFTDQTRFEPEMFKAGPYVGVRVGEELVSVAGTLVLNPRTRVAVLGNIATAPAHRRRGYASSATSSLCSDLLQKVDHIGLNVAATNTPAIKCYEKLGFEVVGEFDGYERRDGRQEAPVG